MLKRSLSFLICIIALPLITLAQDQGITDSTYDINGKSFTLEECVHYALKHQPAVQQSLIDVDIAHHTNNIGISGWLPQVSAGATYEHYINLPATLFGDSIIQTGAINTFIPSITATQTLFNTDVFLAAKASKLNLKYARQGTTITKINTVSEVSKAFYDLLFTIQQINVLKSDTVRLHKNQEDTYHQYISGVVDKVDFKQATIALNNTKASLKTAIETVIPKYAVLKQLMGFPVNNDFNVSYDTARMLQEVSYDTTEELDYTKRVEYQQLVTSEKLLQANTLYYQLGFLPSVSAFYNYNYEYESDQGSNLFNNAYPYSLFGATLSLPLFQGFRRTQNIKKAKLQEDRKEWDELNLKLQINTEYRQALANYKSNLNNLHALGENVQLAQEVDNIVKLQYKEGIKTYLNVITAESDLQTSEINYLNALFQLLASKIDLQKAMGDLSPNI
jgi:outer membrane protein TolC